MRSTVVLDVGCGRGASVENPVRMRRELRAFKGKCARVIGPGGHLCGVLHRRFAPGPFRGIVLAFARKK